MASRLDELPGRECVHQGISWREAHHRVDACSEVRWVGICSGRRSEDPRSEDLRFEDPRSEDPRGEDLGLEDPGSEGPRSEDPRIRGPEDLRF